MENVRNVEANTAAAQECCTPAEKSGRLNPRNLVIGVAVASGVGALVLGWDWLVAAGLAPIVVAAAPCLVMCALGVCMNRMSKRDQTAAGTPPLTTGPDAQAVKARPLTPATDALVVKVEPAVIGAGTRAVNAAPVPESNATVSGSRT